MPRDGQPVARLNQGASELPKFSFPCVWKGARCLLLADCVAKRFCASECARLIQDQGSRYKVDSRIHSPRFDCCVFLFYSFSAVTFATESALNGRADSHHLCPLLKVDRPCHRAAATFSL